MTTNDTSDAPVVGAQLRVFAKITSVSTLLLIFLGGLVKSHEAGLSVPDWPTTFGYNMFLYPISQWTGGVLYEHSHRLFASGVGMLTLILAGWLLFAERRRWLKVLGVCALVAVIVQGILGGVTVLLNLPALVSVSHGVLAQTFFMLTIVIAYALSREFSARRANPTAPVGPALRTWTLAVTGLIYLQLILGAFMRHTESGLAIPDFPKMAGGWLPVFGAEKLEWINTWRIEKAFETGADLPAVTLGQVWIHFAHRAGALVVTVAIVILCVYAWRASQPDRRLKWTAGYLAGLLVVQVLFGIATIHSLKEPTLTSLHVAIGAALLGVSTLMCLRVLPVRIAATTTPAPRTAKEHDDTEGHTAYA
jgi:cytochrome c oxidase assembly protein subunit 15